MDMGDKAKFGLDKGSDDPLNYHSANVNSDWQQFSDASLAGQRLGLVPAENSLSIPKGDLMGSSMVDSFCPTLWDHHNSQNLGFGEHNVHQTSTSLPNAAVIRKGIPVGTRTGENPLDMGWNSSNLLLRGDAFLQNNGRNLPPSLSQFPADSGFIERAARFSCFNGGNFGDIVNPFNMAEPLNPYAKMRGPVQGPPEVLSANGMNSLLGADSQRNELNMAEIQKDHSMSVEHGLTRGSPVKNDREKQVYVRPSDEARQGIGMSSNDSGEGEFSGGGGAGRGDQAMLENDGGEPSSSKGLGPKKRKRPGQNNEIDQDNGASQHSSEISRSGDKGKEKFDQHTTSASNKAAGKHGKDGSQASDAPKEDYIHIRARRGQATNSHSLAERVRREKISERMKFLQELVPGCNKVTGKAVMLDEIINYVQSLQRQVEFLSMKLATVNPRLDFNIEGILGKDILQSRGGPSTLGFLPDMSMIHAQLHPSQQGLIPGGIPGVGSSSDTLRRTITSQLAALNSGYKDLMSQNNQQIPNGWEDELHNVVQMSFGDNAPFNNQDINGSLPPGHMKVEL